MVFAVLDHSIKALGNLSSIDTQIREHLSQLLHRASTLLVNFNNIIQNEMTVQINTTNENATKFPWRSWLKTQSRLRKLSTELRASKTNINLALANMTAYVSITGWI